MPFPAPMVKQLRPYSRTRAWCTGGRDAAGFAPTTLFHSHPKPPSQLDLFFFFCYCPQHGGGVYLAYRTGRIGRASSFAVASGSHRGEMDEYSEFASDDFDVKGWINATVASHLQQQELAAGAGANGSSSSDPAALSSLNAHR